MCVLPMYGLRTYIHLVVVSEHAHVVSVLPRGGYAISEKHKSFIETLVASYLGKQLNKHVARDRILYT